MADVGTIQQFFKYGLDRDVPELLTPPMVGHAHSPQLNLGPGKRKVVPETIGIGLETGWRAPGPMHWPHGARIMDGAIGAIHMYQFIEHFDGDEAVAILRECERVLMPNGVIYIACPHQLSSMAFQALDHKRVWNEEVWNWLFGNEYYDDHEGKGWRLQVHACFIMGIVARNINLFTQLVKV